VLRLNQNYRASFTTSHGRLLDSGGLVGVALSAGTHDLELAYRPPEVRLGFAVTGAAWLLLVGGVLWWRRRPGQRASSYSSSSPSKNEST
jgi:hypothetical protein